MAMLLKREFNLVALKVTLQTRGEAAQVLVELELTEQHEPHTVWSTTVPAEALGVEAETGKGRPDAGVDTFRMPPEIPAAVTGVLREAQYEGPVWLHLVKPYGVLGVLPWERLLASVPHPLLRLPDALAERPVENTRLLDVALCASRPVSEQAFDIPRSLAHMAETIIRSVEGRRVRVHVFADLECLKELEQRLAASGLLGQQVLVAHPDSIRAVPAKPDGEEGGYDALTSPWLQWMQRALHRTPVDAVHFLCHGYLADRRGALAFAESPVRNQDPEWCRFVTGAELSRFMLRVGAWSIAFSSPHGNYSEFGLRALADEFAQVRPGPVLYHDHHDDRDLAQLGQVYRFLYSRTRVPAVPTPALAVCCQPAMAVTGEGAEAPPPPSLQAAAASAIEALDDVPSWIASAQRFVEQKQYEVSRIKRATARLGTKPSGRVEGIERGVDEIKLALERLANKGLLR
jgi:hypothetical protein